MGLPDKRILLVEDEPTTYDLLANILRAGGYVVDVATTFAKALAFLDERSYALVLADWRLPDGDGLVIADTAAAAGAKTLLMSGYLFQMPGSPAIQHEMLMKPLRPSEIIAAVERSIGKPGVRQT
jgi:two-component system response regulator PilR (NtrC family)